jgi:hypothetical protein
LYLFISCYTRNRMHSPIIKIVNTEDLAVQEKCLFQLWCNIRLRLTTVKVCGPRTEKQFMS